MGLRLSCFLIVFLYFISIPHPLGAQGPLLDLLKGQNSEPATPAPKDSLSDQMEKIREKQAKANEALTDLRQQLADPTLDPSGPLLEKLKGQKGAYEELDLYYTQILDALEKQTQLKSELEQSEKNLSSWDAEAYLGSAELNFENLNRLEEQKQIAISKIEASEKTIQTLKTSQVETKDTYETLQTERRKTREAVETTKDPEILPDLKQKLALLNIESDIYKAKILLNQTEITTHESSLKIQKNIAELYGKKLAALQGKVQFTDAELQKKLASFSETKDDLGKQLQVLRQRVQTVQNRLAKTDESDKERIELLELEITALKTKISFISQHFQRLDEIRETWRRRYFAFNNLVEKKELLKWEDETEEILAQTRRIEQLGSLQLSELNKNINQLREEQENSGGLNPSQRNVIRKKIELLSELALAYQQALSQVYNEYQLHQNFLNEINSKTSGFSIGDQAESAWDKALQVWNFELTSIDDRPITVKKLVFVLILSFLGFRFSRKLSRWLGGNILPRLGMGEGVAAGLQTLTFYLLVTLVTLTVLYIVNVPLTIFTVLGGALAIGVGFGSQNILRNFISGLILLAERPIKIGDMVQLDGTYGSIEKIGARSTLVRSFDNIHIILPNSDFLEKKVINWTLSDDLVRIAVKVGIIYGSPTREAATLIKKAVTEHGKVLKEPEPLVLFTDFGSSSLDFEVLFWIRMRTQLDRRRVESDIRYRIDSLFREAGIVIAFPQQDVHLDNIKPLEIKILPEEDEPPPKDEKDTLPSLAERLEEHKEKKLKEH